MRKVIFFSKVLVLNVLLLQILYAKPNISNEIIEIASISDVNNYVTKDSLILFDIDNTLLTSSQSLGSDQWFEYMVKSQIEDGETKNEAIITTLDTWQYVHKLSQVKAMESNTAKIVKSIQSKTPYVFALTARAGHIYNISNKELISIGVNLNNNPDIPDLQLFKSNEAMYQKGIISAGLTGKGRTLKEFLMKSGINNNNIKKIIFVDDKKHNVADVAETAKELNIEFVGLRYGIADNEVKNFSKKIVNKQLSILEMCGKLISDAVAKVSKFKSNCNKII